MATMYLVLSLFFIRFVLGSPAALQERALVCNSDNCLRQLLRSSAAARPYCSSYLHGSPPAGTQTVVVTTTVPAYSNSPLTLIEKRSAADPTITGISSTAVPAALDELELLKRTTASFSPSSCTQNPTAVSSGCSCFLAPTVTSTSTVTSALPTQCNAAHNYGLIANGFGIEDGPGQANHYYRFGETVKGSCCARCFDTTDCLAFSQYSYQDGSIECLIWEIYTSPTTTTQNSLCPLGTLTISITQPDPTNAQSGVGPCGIAAY